MLDFETYFDAKYTVKKMATEAYIRDPRFEPLVLAVHILHGDAFVLHGPEEIGAWIWAQDWPSIAVICHNAVFDVSILTYRYGAIPRAITCTMSLARGVLGPTKEGASLEALAEKFGLPQKNVPYAEFKGKRWTDMDEDLRDRLAAGCARDVEITESLAERFLVGFPPRELDVIDMTIRAASEPQLVADPVQLQSIANACRTRKASSMAALGVTAKQL